jgi:pilus assembly protein CpaB
MKKGQLFGIAIAATAGLAAFVLMRGVVNQPAVEHTVEVQVNATEVLVAAAAIDLGTIANEDLFRWQTWPKDAVAASFITKTSPPEMIQNINGSVVRAPLLPGEPITTDKLIKAGQGGVLAAILPAGMRAISTKITEASAAGRLILPNDHVDVILIRRVRGRNGDDVVSDTLFRNIRVLAIGQQIQNKEGDKSAQTAADTATLELSPQQAETLAQANSVGEISLALRSIADIPKRDGATDAEASLKKKDSGGAIRVLRYGNKSQVSGVN